MGGDTYLGNTITLNCTAESRGTNEQLAISWIYHTESNIPQSSTITSQSLWFDSLAAAHAGVYICNASLGPTAGSEQTNITLQCKTVTFACTHTIIFLAKI
jgi:hypothetical protein